MDFMTAVKTCFRKYFGFSGRARRSEFWWFFLFTVIVSIPLSILDYVLFSGDMQEASPLNSLFSLFVFIPGTAVTFRRLHDTGRSGWWYGGWLLFMVAWAAYLFISVGVENFEANLEAALTGGLLTAILVSALIVIAWGITLLVFLCLDSHQGGNKYGESPKYGGNVNAFD